MSALSDATAHATIAVTDLERARAYYRDTLGFTEARSYAEWAIVFESGSTRFNVYPSPVAGSCQSTVVTFMVADLAVVMTELRDKGVTFEEYQGPGGPYTRDGVAEAGGLRSAWFKDPDGNVLNIVQVT